MSKLYIVGTPIGNLGDITLRAIETLKAVDVIAAEDTRKTLNLLNHFQIKPKKLISYHNFNEKSAAFGLLKLLQSDQTIALVSDAGMPGISDPGFEIIRQALNNKVAVEVIPGVSAVTTAAVLANLGGVFTFLGFLKPKSIQRQNQIKKLPPGLYVAFISPHQATATLQDVASVIGSKARAFIGRELTKQFETHLRGTISEITTQLGDNIKGELTLVFEKVD